MAFVWSLCRLSWRLYVTMWWTVSSTAMPMATVATKAVPVFSGMRSRPMMPKLATMGSTLGTSERPPARTDMKSSA